MIQKTSLWENDNILDILDIVTKSGRTHFGSRAEMCDFWVPRRTALRARGRNPLVRAACSGRNALGELKHRQKVQRKMLGFPSGRYLSPKSFSAN